jgi:predicted nucleic acid-binding protein
MVIVDSTVWIDYLADHQNAHCDWLDRNLGKRRIGLTDLVLTEVLQGYRDDTIFDRIRVQLGKMPILQMSSVELAVASARNYRTLRRGGITIRKTIDCLIATFCIENGHFLLHRDRDFDPFEQHLGLKVIHP